MTKPVFFRTDVGQAAVVPKDSEAVPFGWTGTRAELEASMRDAERLYDAVVERKKADRLRRDADAQRREREAERREQERKAERKAVVERWFDENVGTVSELHDRWSRRPRHGGLSRELEKHMLGE